MVVKASAFLVKAIYGESIFFALKGDDTKA